MSPEDERELTERRFYRAEQEAGFAEKEAPSTPQTRHPAYRLAFRDADFILRDELRPVRFQLELLKPEMLMDEARIGSTIVFYGSARIPPSDAAAVALDGAQDLPEPQRKVVERLAAKAKYCDEAYKLARIVSEKSIVEDGKRQFVVCSGGGPSIMEAATGERFDRLMARLVFTPLKIDACFNWTTCGDAAIARAVTLRDAKGAVVRDDLKGVRPGCPVLSPDPACDLSAYVPGSNGALFSPQGGARISASGLARIGQLLLKDGEDFLTSASIAAMIGPAWVYDGSNGETENGFWCAYGLAVQSLAASPACRNDPFGDGRRRVGHSGDAYGLKSGLWIDRATGRGVAYFVTAVPDDAPRGRSGFTRAEEGLATPP